MGMVSAEHTGWLIDQLPAKPKLVQEMVRGTRELFIGWAENIPLVNGLVDLARRVI